MEINKKEKEFLLKAIDFYWENWNSYHHDNEVDAHISDSLVKKLNMQNVNNNEMSVCRNCGKTYKEHSKASRMCPGKFKYFEAN